MSSREKLIEQDIIKPVESQEGQESMSAKTLNNDESQNFHNPYHFVLVKKPGFEQEGLSWLDIEESNGTGRPERLRKGLQDKGCTHDRYLPDRYHGRIVCSLTTKTPIFVGARRISDGTDSEPARVAPFELEGRPAIPASTLRGMISSVLEAASNSALRVLEKRVLSRRAKMKGESLGAIGMLVKKEDGELGLLPLTLPPLRCKKNRSQGDIYEIKGDSNKWIEIYKKYPAFPLYVDGYQPEGRDKIKLKAGSFLDNDKLKSWSAENEEFWYAKVPNVHLVSDKKVYVKSPKKRKSRNDLFLLGHNEVVTPKYQTARGHTRGILRVLGIEDRVKEIPKTKKHEIFIPFPEDEKLRNDVLDIGNALEKFHMMADERADKEGKYPFELKGMKKTWAEDKKTIRLKEKDLVFFDVEKKGDKYVVSRISLSSIWRIGWDGTVHDFFSEIDPELLPFNPGRKKVSPAELMLGFVEDEKKEEADIALAYAGRVRFSHGILKEEEGKGPYMDEVPLKILASPKPPCPCMYFHRKENGGYIFPSKAESKPMERFTPQGRKVYLHKKDIDSDDAPWETEEPHENCRQKATITPLKPGLTFCFHVDFENLTKDELGLLLYSLRPSSEFLHKIGMGKPIGLGTVKVKPLVLLTIDRTKRYREENPFEDGMRFSEVYGISSNEKKELSAMLDSFGHYGEELSALDKAEQIGSIDKFLCFAEQVDKDIKTALELIGNPQSVDAPVLYPYCHNLGPEEELFKWFEKNEKGKHQFLEPIEDGKTMLKPLTTEYCNKK